MASTAGLPERESTLKALRKAGLYGILDTGYSNPSDWPSISDELITGGVGILQIRAKRASEAEIRAWTPPVIEVCRAARIPLILNDHPKLAYQMQLDGCHLGQDDLPLAEAREILDPSQIVGKSTHSLAQAIQGEKEGADYIGFGPIFSTATKPDYHPIGQEDIRKMYDNISIPAFCIGGIKRERIELLLQQGAQRFVIVSGLLKAVSPRDYASEVLQRISDHD
ncbi:MAG: thiamine phosphate synthase [Verrucomicrobiota bacterium]